ncbi:hypothetical protein [Azospirillum melinis]
MRGPAASAPVINGRRRGYVRGILLWLVGIPIPVILLLYLFNIL